MKPAIEVLREAEVEPTPAAIILAEVIAPKLERVRHSYPEKYSELKRAYIAVMKESLKKTKV